MMESRTILKPEFQPLLSAVLFSLPIQPAEPGAPAEQMKPVMPTPPGASHSVLPPLPAPPAPPEAPQSGPAALSEIKPNRAHHRDALEALRQVQFPILFEVLLDLVSSGLTINEILANDVRPIEKGQLMRWIKGDIERQERYYEAQRIGAEFLAAETRDLAIGNTGTLIPEEIARSKLRIEVNQNLMRAYDKKRFGEVRQVELEGSINLRNVLDAARSRAAEVVDVLPK